jgi:SDR family mycofactocin-dependent oxidoreductase
MTSNERSFEGKVFLITGGARGQGRQIALKAASQGADIVVVDRCEDIEKVPYPLATREDLAETQRLVEQLGRRCVTSVGDVRSQDDMDAAVAAAVGAFGRVDVFCANAGIHSFTPLWDMTEQEWDAIVDVCMTGVWRGIKAVAPVMMAQESGSIIITSSVKGKEAGKDLAHYASAKHGVLGLMKSAAYELAPYNVRCNAVLPSVVHSAMGENPETRKWIFKRDDATTHDYIEATKHWHILPGRPGLPPRSIANAVCWLASDEAQYITGIELPVDAGHLLLEGFNHDRRSHVGQEVGPWY